MILSLFKGIKDVNSKYFLLGLLFLLSIHCNLDIPKEIEVEFGSLPEKIDFNYHVKPILSDLSLIHI